VDMAQQLLHDSGAASYCFESLLRHPLTAAPVSIDPYVLASGHETVFEGSEVEGALGRRCWQAQGGARQDLLRVDAHHKTLAKKTNRDRGCGEPEAIPGRPARKGKMLKEWLPEHLEANEDHTLEEHREAFEEHFGEEVSTSTIGTAIAAMPQGGWPLKKSRP
jgi:hypothetical protein